jgi:hypothetical protein
MLDDRTEANEVAPSFRCETDHVPAPVGGLEAGGLPGREPPTRDAGADAAAAAGGQEVVGPRERVDGVVVGPVREGAQLVEELVDVAAADDPDQPVLGRPATGCARTCLAPATRSL